MLRVKLSAMTALCHVLRTVYHGHGEPGNADQFLLLVADLDTPHMAALADVVRPCRRGHDARGDGPEVIGVDLLPQAHVKA